MKASNEMDRVMSTGRLARLSAGHGKVVVLLWILGLFLLAIGSIAAGGELSDEEEFIGEPESTRAYDLIGQRMDRGFSPSDFVIVRSERLTVDDPEFQQTVETVSADLERASRVVDDAPNYYELLAAGDDRAGLLVSSDRHTTLIPVSLGFDEDSFVDTVNDVASRNPSYEVLTVGETSIDDETDRLIESDLIRAEVIGIPVSLIILIIIFGALVAAIAPIALALVSIAGAIFLALLLGAFTNMSIYVVNMITMIGMAVGIDYSLFVLGRYREERHRGLDTLDAMAIAGSTASRTVVYSGVTVAIALSGMYLLPTTLFRSLGLGAILAVLVAVLATLTLLPAFVGLAGDRLEWPRRRSATPQSASGTEPELSTRHGFWAGVSRVVMAKPVVSVLLAGGLLLAAAVPYLRMEYGTAGVESLPDGDVKHAYEVLAANFPAGLVEPIEVVIDAKRDDETEAAIASLTKSLASDQAFGPVIGTEWNSAGDLAILTVPLAGDGNGPDAYSAVDRLRDEIVPAAFSGVDGQVLVTGDIAENADLNHLVSNRTPFVLALVLGLSFVVLLLAFRSIVVPLKAIVMNLLSVGAAYGLLVLVFQEGVGAGLLGFTRTPSIEVWVPIFLFCVLFGLSMDYHIFLLSRIREYYDRSGDNRASVAAGLQSTGKIITGAALIMVVVFSAFASGDLVMFQQLGFGLAIAIALDATVVRCVLVPATMVLLGNRNWYLPKWLEWLPDLRLEGAPEASQPMSPVSNPAN
jgi:RND superfamily putative drug exporter